MANIIMSNKEYRGDTPLPNLIDRVVTDTEKSSFLKLLLRGVGSDSSKVNNANTSVLFNALKAYRDRVSNDGGVITSLGKTLDALIFANENSILNADFSAYGADFGMKLSAGSVSKIYDLSSAARDLAPIFGSCERVIDSGFAVFTQPPSVATSAYSKTPITSAGGYVIGASSHDKNILTSHINGLRPIMLNLNPTGNGIPPIVLENDYGLRAALIYPNSTGGETVSTFPYSTSPYKKYAGLSGLIKTNEKGRLFENGVFKSSAGLAAKNMDTTVLYPAFTIYQGGGFVRESWVINSTSEDLAVNLGKYLDKS